MIFTCLRLPDPNIVMRKDRKQAKVSELFSMPDTVILHGGKIKTIEEMDWQEVWF